MELLELFDHATGWSLGMMSRTEAEQRTEPSVCDRWRVQNLMDHMQFALSMLADAAGGAELTLEDYINLPDWKDAPLGAPAVDADAPSYALQRAKTLEALRGDGVLERTFVTPLGALPAVDDVRIVIADQLIHGWDLAASTGQDGTMPDVFIPFLKEMTELEVYESLRGIAFADVVDVDEGASDQDKLVAFFGRDPQRGRT